MPFTKHIIQPINISQCPLPLNEFNELECLSNLTLANIIRQLSSLGEHANRVFTELTQDAQNLTNRTKILTNRIDTLKIKVSKLDIQAEEVSLTDCHNKKQFKSSIKIDQQVVNRNTMPEAMRIMYENAEPPPSLDKLNKFRTDGKNCMKFYTDPDYFFNLWCIDIMKENERNKLENKKKRKPKSSKSDLQKPRDLIPQSEQHKALAQGVEFAPPAVNLNRIKDDHYGYTVNNQPTNSHQHQQTYTREQTNSVTNYVHNNNTDQQFIYNYSQYQYQQQTSINNENIPKPPAQFDNTEQQIYKTHRGSISPNSQTERPGMPPPPIPIHYNSNNINKKNEPNNLQSNVILYNREDLPPPPSPPNYIDEEYSVHNSNGMFNQNIRPISPSPPPPISPDHVDSFELPLPPPPNELVHDIMQSSDLSKKQHPAVPPPPPAPPLPVFNFNSSQLQQKTVKDLNSTNQSTKISDNDDVNQARNCVLDDIKRGQYRLRAIKENERKEKEAEGFASNVAAILDFISTYRPHVEPSSDEDEENSDWDD